MQTHIHARSSKRSRFLAGAGAALAIMLVTTSAQAQTSGTNATGVRTLANQQTSQNGITRADFDEPIIASIITGSVDGGELEIADNEVETAARGNDAIQRLDAELTNGEGYGLTRLTASRQSVDANGASVIANRQTTGASEVVTDIFATELSVDAGAVSSSALTLSRNTMNAAARGNDATAEIALSGRRSDSGAGIASYQSTGPGGGGVAARARARTALTVGAVSESALDNSFNLDLATAHGNSADNRIAVEVTDIAAPASSEVASTVPLAGVGDPTAAASFGLLSSQTAGGVVKARAGDFDGGPASHTVIGGNADGASVTSDGNGQDAGAFGNRSANEIVLDAASIGDTPPAAGNLPGAVANVTNIQRADISTLVASTVGGTAIAAQGDVLESTLSASGNSIRTVATANLATGNQVVVQAGSIEAKGGNPAIADRATALIDVEGGASIASAFGVQNVQDFGRSAVTAMQTSSATAVLADGAVEHSTIRVDGNVALAGATGNSAINETELSATSMATSAAVNSLQTGNGTVSATIGNPDPAGGALIVATGGLSDARLFVTGNSATGTTIGSSASNSLTVSSAGISGTDGPQAESGTVGGSYGAAGIFALASNQKLGEPVTGDVPTPRVTSGVFGETGIVGGSVVEGSTLAVSNNAQRANALGNTSANRIDVLAATLEDGVTTSLSSFQYGQAEVAATSGAKLKAPATLDGATVTLSGNSSVALAAMNDTDNSLSIDTARIGDVGVGAADLDASPLGAPAASGDHLVTNQQFAAGGVGAIAYMQVGNAETSGGLTGSRFEVSDNVASAEASANRARNAASGSLSSGALPGIGVATTQVNTAQVSASTLMDSGYAVTNLDAGVTGSSIASERHAASALARGSAVDNQLTISVGSTASPASALSRIDAFDASALAPATVLNMQSNYGAVTATANDTGHRLPLNGPGAFEGTSVTLTGNSMTANAYGNSANNIISVLALGQAPGAAIANAQTNYGNVSALVTGAGLTGAPGSMSVSTLSITGNQLAASAGGNQASSAITTPR
jgi:hypothetical protein